MENVYTQQALAQVPRLLTLLDRDPDSPTFGCFDRQYWRYKTRDYVNARFQEAAYTLALLYTQKMDGNTWYRQAQVREWSIAGMKFWAGLINRRGYLDEYYPAERSQVAVAFSSFCIAKAYLLLKVHLPEVETALARAGHFLEQHMEPEVVNHEAGAAASLYLIYRATGLEEFRTLSEKRRDLVLSLQDAEGWFPEYGGADIGYLSFTLYYLSALHQLAPDEKIRAALEKGMDFFQYFVHPDGSMGGSYGSRETTFVLPVPFEQHAGKIPSAGSIADALRTALETGRVAGPHSFDDRYVTNALYPYLECAEQASVPSRQVSRLPCLQKDSTRYFLNAGLYVQKAGPYFAVFNVKKGGVGKIFRGRTLVLHDTGWTFSRGWFRCTTNGPSTPLLQDNRIEITAAFYQVPRQLLTFLSSTLLRLLAKAGLNRWVKSRIRRVLVAPRKVHGKRMQRTIRISREGVEIVDDFEGVAPQNLRLSSNSSRIYTTSLGLFDDTAKNAPLRVEWEGHTAKIRI